MKKNKVNCEIEELKKRIENLKKVSKEFMILLLNLEEENKQLKGFLKDLHDIL